MGLDKASYNPIFKICKVMSCLACVVCFVLNSFAIFQDFIKGTTIISTRVVSHQWLSSPLLVLCNSTPFKESILNTNLEDYKNNTLRFDDVLEDVLFVKDASQNALGSKPVSIKGRVREVQTMIHGNCFIIDSKMQVDEAF